jgi:hypothetical protein
MTSPCGGNFVLASVPIRLNDFNVRRLIRRFMRRSAAVILKLLKFLLRRSCGGSQRLVVGSPPYPLRPARAFGSARWLNDMPETREAYGPGAGSKPCINSTPPPPPMRRGMRGPTFSRFDLWTVISSDFLDCELAFFVSIPQCGAGPGLSLTCSRPHHRTLVFLAARSGKTEKSGVLAYSTKCWTWLPGALSIDVNLGRLEDVNTIAFRRLELMGTDRGEGPGSEKRFSSELERYGTERKSRVASLALSCERTPQEPSDLVTIGDVSFLSSVVRVRVRTPTGETARPVILCTNHIRLSWIVSLPAPRAQRSGNPGEANCCPHRGRECCSCFESVAFGSEIFRGAN